MVDVLGCVSVLVISGELAFMDHLLVSLSELILSMLVYPSSRLPINYVLLFPSLFTPSRL